MIPIWLTNRVIALAIRLQKMDKKTLSDPKSDVICLLIRVAYNNNEFIDTDQAFEIMKKYC